MKAGDLVEIGPRETLRGRQWEDQIGIIIMITDEDGFDGGAALVNFGGTIIKYAVKRLGIVSESR